MDLKKLIKNRGTIKSSLTRFESYLNSENVQLNQIKQRLKIAESLISEFNSIQDEIEEATLAEESNDCVDETERTNFENHYYAVIAAAQAKINEAGQSVSTSRSETLNNQNLANIKLPTLELPKFNGSYDEWLKFYDTFNSLIHVNTSLNSIQKFHYLISSLSGDAGAIIESLEVSDANYKIAWDLLRERFDNKRIIIRTHVKSLFNLECIKTESHTNIRNLIDSFKKHIRALKTLQQPTDKWDTLLIHIMSSKLDYNTMHEWEKTSADNNYEKMDDLEKFLIKKASILETLKPECKSSMHLKTNQVNNKKLQQTYYENANNVISNNCVYCNGSHVIYNCVNFLKLSISQRIDQARKIKLCMNCLRNNHFTNSCLAKACKHCNKRHNSLLHLPERNNQNQSAESVNMASNQSIIDTNVLLSTAYVEVKDAFGNLHQCRALLDSGAQSNFITNDLCNKLNLKTIKTNITIAGVGKASLNINKLITLNIKSRQNKFKSTLSFLVLPKITNNLPIRSFNPNIFQIPKKLFLADPSFYESKEVDMLLGASIFWELLCIGQFSLGKNLPIMQKTQLGWIISGNMNLTLNSSIKNSNRNFHQTLEDNVAKFWEIEELPNEFKHLSIEERECEDLFTETTTRDPNGRFIVRLPLKGNLDELGDSRHMAMKRLFTVERKFQSNENLKQQYHSFMEEYESLGHMTEISANTINREYFLPHHAIIKESSLTTKLRVVFDGSAKTSSGFSINDYQMVGPVLQNDLFSIILRFRKHPIVLTADISKMYRQIIVHKNDRHLQKIIWRKNVNENAKHYTLNTVTYGTAAASYLAIRCLQQLAHERAYDHPKASTIILNDFYVDDLITGACTVKEAIDIQKTVSDILKSGGFEIRKWVSNNNQVLKSIPHESLFTTLSFSDNQQFKTLGLQWNSESDCLLYSIQHIQTLKSVTKRTILSCTAQIFDPLGLVCPVTITAKLIIQQLWQLELSWDESIPSSLHNAWQQFFNSIHSINNLSIPRLVIPKNSIDIQLHGFSDASEKAYGACLYVRCIDSKGGILVSLLCAKSRVAPLKSISLPRLELCGALLLAKLSHQAIKAMKISFNDCHYWSDSTVVLAWLNSQPSKWKTFVANRVSEIHTLTVIKKWHHVKSNDNPADLISRGIDSNKLLNSKLWWQGPTWLNSAEKLDFAKGVLTDTLDPPEMKRQVNLPCFTATCEQDIFARYSSLVKLQKVFTHMLRFRHNSQKRNKECKIYGPISTEELEISANRLIKMAQQQQFAAEINKLARGKSISTSSKILNLRPFLDKHGLIRVGGRLENSIFNYDKKHPIILPYNHTLTTLIIRKYHIDLMHAGSQLLLASMRENFWPIRGKSAVKGVIHNCIPCFKARPTTVVPQMGQLPQARISPARAFFNSGVDYAGPVLLKDRLTRGPKLIKAYICVFVCFATKAVHLELVSSLTTEAFLAAFRRFVARRGICSNIYSDNGANFIGANSELAELSKFLNNEDNNRVINESVIQNNTNWHFIPAKSPHFGGLWEAGVKSIKFHLNRVLSHAHVTFEELYTILTQIEACLNSRPMCPLSDDPYDLSPLTPGHFLIGEPLISLPDPNVLAIKESRLSRFQRCQQLTQHFWKRWSQEYISTLQQLPKWKKSSSVDIQPGMMVILKEEDLPPTKWKLGRIVEIHPGKDNIVRVVTVKTSKCLVKRSVQKVCALPIDNLNCQIA